MVVAPNIALRAAHFRINGPAPCDSKPPAPQIGNAHDRRPATPQNLTERAGNARGVAQGTYWKWGRSGRRTTVWQ